jgi:hypothetical protein
VVSDTPDLTLQFTVQMHYGKILNQMFQLHASPH